MGQSAEYTVTCDQDTVGYHITGATIAADANGLLTADYKQTDGTVTAGTVAGDAQLRVTLVDDNGKDYLLTQMISVVNQVQKLKVGNFSSLGDFDMESIIRGIEVVPETGWATADFALTMKNVGHSWQIQVDATPFVNEHTGHVINAALQFQAGAALKKKADGSDWFSQTDNISTATKTDRSAELTGNDTPTTIMRSKASHQDDVDVSGTMQARISAISATPDVTQGTYQSTFTWSIATGTPDAKGAQ